MHPTAYDHGELGSHPEDVIPEKHRWIMRAIAADTTQLIRFVSAPPSPPLQASFDMLLALVAKSMSVPPKYMRVESDACDAMRYAISAMYQ